MLYITSLIRNYMIICFFISILQGAINIFTNPATNTDYQNLTNINQTNVKLSDKNEILYKSVESAIKNYNEKMFNIAPNATNNFFTIEDTEELPNLDKFSKKFMTKEEKYKFLEQKCGIFKEEKEEGKNHIDNDGKITEKDFNSFQNIDSTKKIPKFIISQQNDIENEESSEKNSFEEEPIFEFIRDALKKIICHLAINETFSDEIESLIAFTKCANPTEILFYVKVSENEEDKNNIFYSYNMITNDIIQIGKFEKIYDFEDQKSMEDLMKSIFKNVYNDSTDFEACMFQFNTNELISKIYKRSLNDDLDKYSTVSLQNKKTLSDQNIDRPKKVSIFNQNQFNTKILKFLYGRGNPVKNPLRYKKN